MKVFRFRLQKVLDLREAAEKLAAQTLGEAVQGLRAAEDRRRRLGEAQKQALEALHARLLQGRLDPLAMRLCHAELEAFAADLKHAHTEETRAKARMDACQEDLRARRRDRMAIESLRERAQELHLAEERRVEGLEMDEVASILHRRNEEPRAAT